MKNYMCHKCKTHLQSASQPSTFNCPGGGQHQWTDLGDVGSVNYQCKKCAVLVQSKSDQAHLIVLLAGSINGRSSNYSEIWHEHAATNVLTTNLIESRHIPTDHADLAALNQCRDQNTRCLQQNNNIKNTADESEPNTFRSDAELLVAV